MLLEEIQRKSNFILTANMWLYSFQGRYGTNKICRTGQGNLAVGDLLVGGTDMFLVMGDEIAWNVDKNKYQISEPLTVFCDGFLGGKTIMLIHRLTNHYYTSYKNVVKLFIPGEIADLFKKQISTKKKTEQTLYVYPDVRTMENSEKSNDSDEKGIAILNGTSTPVQQDKARWGIKMGHIHTLKCTYSQLFQDWKTLTKIILVDSHQWYYKNQQDPRYDTREVVQKMAELYQAELITTGIDIFAEERAK